jgi:hypothetical protein
MDRRQVPVGVPAYTAVFSKDLGDLTANALLQWYWARKHKPADALNAAVKSFHRRGKLDDAARIALHYPHLSAARRLFRIETDLTMRLLTFEYDAGHPAAAYALGIAELEAGDPARAKRFLEEALQQADHPKSRETIRRLLAPLAMK